MATFTPHATKTFNVTVSAAGNVALTQATIPSFANTNEPVSFKIEGHVETASVTNPAIAIAYGTGPADYITIKRGDGTTYNLQKGYMLLKYTQSTQNPCYYLRSWEGSPSWDSVIFPTAGDYGLYFYSGVVTGISAATGAVKEIEIKTQATETQNLSSLIPLAIVGGLAAALYFIKR